MDKRRIRVAVALQIGHTKALPLRSHMKKLTFWVGALATGLIFPLTTACSSDPDDPGTKPSTGGSGTGGSGTAGSATAGMGTGGLMGTQLQSPNYLVTLTGADVTAGMPAPAAYMTNCSACHGASAQGMSGLGPENRFTPKDYAVAVVRGGRSAPNGTLTLMTAWPQANISDADLDAINLWQNSFPKPPTGQGMYLAMCGNCHGPTAGGGSAPIGVMGKSKADVANFVRNGNGTDFANRKEYMPKFDTTLLTEADLALIEGYLNSM